MGRHIGLSIAAFFGIIGLIFCIPAVFFLWLAGTIAMDTEEKYE